MDTGDIEAIAVDASGHRAAVAGRSVLKIVKINNDATLSDDINLKMGKNSYLRWAAKDVAWSHVAEENIATGSTTGVVVLWNLHQAGKSKQISKYQLHERQVQKVAFHKKDANILISCSLDGIVKMVDFRQNEESSSFAVETANDGVRDVEFNNFYPSVFAAAYDSGDLRLWDIRKTDKALYRLSCALSCPIISLHFHPTAKAWIATASRNRQIKVWSVERQLVGTAFETPNDGNDTDPIFEPIETSEPVMNVRWRPGLDYQLASTALLYDCSINVWDVRRCYIPFATYTCHSEVISGIEWCNEKMIISCSKDGVIKVTDLKLSPYIHHPIKHMSPVSIAIAPSGQLALASEKLRKLDINGYIMRSHVDKTEIADPFRTYRDSALMLLDNASMAMLVEHEQMVGCANGYRLCGYPIAALCEHNANVAESFGRPFIAQFWRLLIVLYATDEIEMSGKLVLENKSEPSSTARIEIDKNQATKDLTRIDEAKESTRGLSHGQPYDFYFGFAETIDHTSFPLNIINPDDVLPVDSNMLTDKDDFELLSVSANYTTSSDTVTTHATDTSYITDALELKVEPPPIWQHKNVIAKQLYKFIELGDIQTPVSALIVLGARGRDIVDARTQEHWFTDYLDILEAKNLWHVSTRVAGQCWIPSIRTRTQLSVAVQLYCCQCRHPIPISGVESNQVRVPSLCSYCHRQLMQCIVCNTTVRGLFVWCRGCAHGGHVRHINDWFNEHELCPTGCGHACYSFSTQNNFLVHNIMSNPDISSIVPSQRTSPD